MINHAALHDDDLGKAVLLSTSSRKSAASQTFEFGSGPAVPARAYISTPVYSDFTENAQVVGTLGVLAGWEYYFMNVLPDHVKGIDVVVDDSCNKAYTFRISGETVTISGEGDLHDRGFDSQRSSFTLGGTVDDEDADFVTVEGCSYEVDIYPTKELEDEYLSTRPMFYAVAVAVIFVFTAFVFLAYDWAVQLRQNKVLKTATRTQAIVSSLFPKNVQERIFKDVEDEVKQEEKTKNPTRGFRGNRTKDQLKTFLDDGGGDKNEEGPASLKSKPIADLFPEATIIFAE